MNKTGLGSLAITAHHPFRSPEAKQKYLNFYDRWVAQWPAPSETRIAETSFGQTFIRVQGPVGGAPLVLLPGDTETSLSWLPAVEAFSKSLRSYAIDRDYDNGWSIYTREILIQFGPRLFHVLTEAYPAFWK